jgi:hypothetical protein
MLLSHFQSQPNLNLVYSIIQQEVANNYQVTLDDYEQALEIKSRLRGIIKGFSGKINPNHYKDDSGENMAHQIAQLNKKVVSFCVPGFQQMIQRAQRDPSIRINRIAHRPVDTTQLSTQQAKQDESVTDQYERISEARKISEPKPPSVPDFTDPTVPENTLQNPSVLYDQMEQKRQRELDEFTPDQPKNQDGIDTSQMKRSTQQNMPFTVENQGNTNHNDQIDGMVEFTRVQQAKKTRDLEFEQRLKTLQDKRNLNFKNNTNSTPIDELPIVTAPDINQEHVTSIYQQRNQIDDQTRSHPQDIDIKKLITSQAMVSANDQFSNDSIAVTTQLPTIPNQDQVIFARQNTVQPPHETHHIIIINAEDRPWYGSWSTDSEGNDIMVNSLYPNRYHFPVKFSPASGPETITSIKSNFRNIITLEVIDVMLSTHDNPTFIGGVPPLDQDITTSIPILSSDCCNEDQGDSDTDSCEEVPDTNETNILAGSGSTTTGFGKKILLPELLPYVQLSIYKYPYLLLNIEEFTGKFYSTSRANQNMISRLVIAKHYLQRHGRGSVTNNLLNGYFLLKPMLSGSGNELNFYPTPLTKLDTFTISLTTPDGSPYGENNPWNLDGVGVTNISLNHAGLYSTLDLYVDKPFHPCLYLRGDSILLHQIRFLQTNETRVNIKTELDQIETEIYQYLNAENTSFTVISTHYEKTVTETPHHPTFHNIITISIPISIDNNCCIHKRLQISNNSTSDKPEWQVGGFVLNRSIQPTYTVKITCLSSEISREALALV